jgi:multidrug resistance efflux pump
MTKENQMHPNPRILIPVVVVVIALVSYGGYSMLNASAQTQAAVVSGTIEATEIHLGTQMGGVVDQMYAEEGQGIQKDQVLAEVQPASGVSAGYTEKVRSTLTGVVLERVAEPGEIVLPGGTLLVLADLSSVTLTVYVPEDRFGRLNLGQQYPVSVDSFPGRTFSGTVTHISDQAEFTPRNVQTVGSRKITVFAVRLTIDNPDQALKPGMPADVNLE